MEKNGGKTDYSRITSRQIAVYKTDKALLELVDSLKPAGASYPAHIHASGEEDEEGYSLIRLQMVDYSAGTGQKSVSVYANISPDEALYLYSRIFSGVQTFFIPLQCDPRSAFIIVWKRSFLYDKKRAVAQQNYLLMRQSFIHDNRMLAERAFYCFSLCGASLIRMRRYQPS